MQQIVWKMSFLLASRIPYQVQVVYQEGSWTSHIRAAEIRAGSADPMISPELLHRKWMAWLILFPGSGRNTHQFVFHLSLPSHLGFRSIYLDMGMAEILRPSTSPNVWEMTWGDHYCSTNILTKSADSKFKQVQYELDYRCFQKWLSPVLYWIHVCIIVSIGAPHPVTGCNFGVSY